MVLCVPLWEYIPCEGARIENSKINIINKTLIMKDKTLKLTESQLLEIVTSATKEVIKEMTTAHAAIASGANAASFRDYLITGSPESEIKQNKSDLIRLPVITKAIIDKFGHFKLKLQEYNEKTRMAYVNYFVFDCVVHIDLNSFVFKGEISVGGRPYAIGYIRYIFEDNIWQRVKCGPSMRISTISQLEPFKPNLQLAVDIIDFLKSFLSKEIQNQKDAKQGQFKQSKLRKPLNQQARANLYGDYLNAYNKKTPITPTENL